MIVKKSATIAVTSTATDLESLFKTALGATEGVLQTKWDSVHIQVPLAATETVYFQRSPDDSVAIDEATTDSFAITAGGEKQLSGTSVVKWSLVATGTQNVFVEVGMGNGVTTDFSDDSSITVGSVTATVNTDSDIAKVGGTSVPTVGSTPIVPTGIYDSDGNQITSFGSPSTIAKYISPSDFSATYTSSTTVTLSATPFTMASAQIVYIRVIPASGDAEVYVNGSGGVTMTISSNVLTIAGAGTPFASGDSYEVGINGQDKAYDSGLDGQKTLIQDWQNSLDPQPLVTASDIGAADGVYIDQGSEISVPSWCNTVGLFVKFTVNNSTTNTIKVLSKHKSGGSEEFVLETTGDYIKTLGDANINIFYEFDTSGNIPYLQVQSAAGTVGATKGTLEIYYVLGKK